jgi:plasmid stabilization system protein ParE
MIKRFRVRLRDSARADYASEYRYSREQWGREHAEKYFSTFDGRIAQLAEHPWGSKVPGQPDEWRQIILPGHLVLYRVNEAAGVVEVFRILGRNRFGQIAEAIRAAKSRS